MRYKPANDVGIFAGLALIAVALIGRHATSAGLLQYYYIALGLLVYFVILGVFGELLKFDDQDIGGFTLLLFIVFWVVELVAVWIVDRPFLRPFDGLRMVEFVIWIAPVLLVVAQVVREVQRAEKSA